MRVRRIIPIVIAVAAMSWAAPVYAVSYGSSATPIRATSDGNAAFYGNVTVHNHQSLYNVYKYKDTAPGGNYVYVQTDWFYWLSCDEDGGDQCFDPSGSDQSARTRSGTWVGGTDADDLDPRTDKGRAATKVCEDQSWSPDPCSKKVLVTLSY